MSLILSGTDGLSDVDGSAATPAIRGTDANTGIFFPAADTIAFAEGGAEVARFDSSGNFCLGTAAVLTSGKISLQANLSTANAMTIRDSGTTYGVSSYYTLYQNSAGGTVGGIGHTAVTSLGINAITDLQFFTASTERMRLDASGNLGVGTTSPRSGYLVTIGAGGTGATNGSLNLDGSNASGQGPGIRFARNSTATGYIGSASWLVGGTSSDLVFSANSSGTEAMRIDSSGNVGINSTSPGTYGRLDINQTTDPGTTPAALSVRTVGVGGGTAVPQYGINVDAAQSYNNASILYGIKVVAAQNVGGTTYGVHSTTNAGNSTTNRWAIYGKANVNSDASHSLSTLPVGVYGEAGNSGGTGNVSTSAAGYFLNSSTLGAAAYGVYIKTTAGPTTSIPLRVDHASSELMRLDSSGNLLVGTTTANPAVLNAAGAMLAPTRNEFSVDGSVVGIFNRKTDDGEIIQFRQAGTTEGTISVSGTTVSYNGGHLSRWAQTTAVKDESLVKGTVLSNLDEMNTYTDAEGGAVDNEQLNKVKVSDVEGDVNVAGVFVNWSHDEQHNVDEINMAMTGDMIIRIAQGTTVARGDLLMSAGDGTAKPQGDDIVRSKTVAKVTSNHVTCTYADGSYCVPCVLMAC
jgi:hypothetical protein